MLQFQIATNKTVGGVGFLSIFVPLHRWLTLQDWLWWAHLKRRGFYFTFIWPIAFLVDLQYSSLDKLITIFKPFFSKILLLVTHHKYSKLTSHVTRHTSHVTRRTSQIFEAVNFLCLTWSAFSILVFGQIYYDPRGVFFRKLNYFSSHVTRHTTHVARYTSHDTRHTCGH